MSNVHAGLRAEYAAAECARRKHPLSVRRKRMVAPPNGPYGGPYKSPGEWEYWVYCVCGAYRAPVRVQKETVIGDLERVDVLP